MEEDHQLVQLYFEEIIDFVIAEDTDIVALGCGVVVNKISFASPISRKEGHCKIVVRKDIPIFKENGEDYLMVLITMLGTDYIDRVLGFGVKKVESWAKAYHYGDSSAKEELLAAIARDEKWPQNKGPCSVNDQV